MSIKHFKGGEVEATFTRGQISPHEASILQKVQILLLPIKKTGRTKYPYSKISGKILVDEAVGMGF